MSGPTRPKVWQTSCPGESGEPTAKWSSSEEVATHQQLSPLTAQPSDRPIRPLGADTACLACKLFHATLPPITTMPCPPLSQVRLMTQGWVGHWSLANPPKALSLLHAGNFDLAPCRSKRTFVQKKFSRKSSVYMSLSPPFDIDDDSTPRTSLHSLILRLHPHLTLKP